MKNKITYKYRLFILLLGIVMISFGFIEGDKNGKTSSSKIYKPTNTNEEGGKKGDAYRLYVNNINLPMDRSGKLADVNIPPDGTLGRFDESSFLFSGGFMLSGYAGGTLFANAVASASLVEDYVPGIVGSQNNAEMYVVKRNDPPGGQAYQDWADAVALGADFYDINGDGVYDPDIDMPDLLGDETVWCVYNDGVAQAGRRWNAVAPIGIEVRQTAFALNSKGPIGNIIFLRYRLKYVGTGKQDEPDKLTDVYFGTWDDPDIGGLCNADVSLDIVGSDIPRNAIFTYKADGGTCYGNNPPAFFATFFSGPAEYIPGETFVDNDGDGEYTEGTDEPIDTAHSVRGRNLGIVDYPGARNQPLSSVIEYFNGFSDPNLVDPDNHNQARHYMLGLKSNGASVDPCTFSVGDVVGGVDCSTVDPLFWFSGDPVTNVGWIGNQPWDVRQMANTGPFTLYKDTQENRDAGRLIEKEIIVAYVIGRGTDRLNSITVAREINDLSQTIFNNNFPSPPAPPAIAYEVNTGSNFINLTWLTAADGPLPIGQNPGDNMRYIGQDTVLNIDRWVQGFYVDEFRTASSTPTVGGENNIVEVANYSVTNGVDTIRNIYYQTSDGGIQLRRAVAPDNHILDSAFYADPEKGRIRLTITKDPFTGGPLIKGKEYYFSITQYTLNHNAIVNRETGENGGTGDYIENSAYEEFNLLYPLQDIYEGQTQIITVVFGQDLYSFGENQLNGTQSTGASDGAIISLVVNKEELTGDDYSVEFFKDDLLPAGQPYNAFWRLINNKTNQVLIDSSKYYNFDTTNYSGNITEGFILKVKPVVPEIGLSNTTYEPASNEWFTAFYPDSSTGVFYVGRDNPQGSAVSVATNTSARSDFIRSDRIRKVELRFGDAGKAYRYVNGFVGTIITRKSTFVYAEGVTAADTGGVRGYLGKFGEGFVDVPFTAWVVDERYNEEQQLAVGFIEISSDQGGIPDGNWDPGTRATPKGNEVIAIFDAPYDPSGSQIEYTGNSNGWADILKSYVLNDPNATPTQISIAASKWFNVMYVVGLKKQTQSSSFQPGDIFTIPVEVYPYTDLDKFTFKTIYKGELTPEQKSSLWDKVNVYPNPLYGFNPATSYNNSPADEPFVTFSNLPEEVTIKIYTLSGTLIRTLTTDDKSNPTSPLLRWNLQNESGLRAASGLYIAIVSSPSYGDKILKFSIIMPQKQIQKY